MNNPFRTSEDYELFIYSLTERFRSIRHSTLSFIRRGATLARVAGELHFDCDIRLVVRERLLYHCLPAILDWYGYEVWRNEKKMYWYDSQPHPNELALQSTHPHHKHINPNIKHNRIPSPDICFNKPNLSILINEIETLVKEIQNEC